MKCRYKVLFLHNMKKCAVTLAHFLCPVRRTNVGNKSCDSLTAVVLCVVHWKVYPIIYVCSSYYG